MTIRLVAELYSPDTTSTRRFLTGIGEALAGVAPVRVLVNQPITRRISLRPFPGRDGFLVARGSVPEDPAGRKRAEMSA